MNYGIRLSLFAIISSAKLSASWFCSTRKTNLTETDNKITIELNKVYLDRATVNIVPNSFIRLEDECSKNLLVKYESGEKVMDYWNQSLIEKSYEYIEENFNDSVKIQSYAIREVKDLVRTITDKNVEVIFNR